MSLQDKRTEKMVFIAPYPITRQGILKILAVMDISPQIAANFNDITAVTEETGLILTDLFSFDQSYRTLFSALRTRAPQAVLLALVNEDSESLRDSVICAGADIVVNVNRADTELPTAIRCAALWPWPEDGKGTEHEREVNGMEEERILERKFTRRSFLKGAAATAAAAGVVVAGGGTLLKTVAEAAGDAAAESGEQVFYGSCRANCFGGCRVKVTVRGGKVVKTEMAEFPDKRYNRICAKGITHMQTMYAADRLKYPIKRVGERGAGQWEQITWEEAVGEITDSWKKYIEESGGKSIIFSAGTGNFGSVSWQSQGRLQGLLGAASATSAYDNTALSTSTKCFGVGPHYSANEMADLLNAKTILLWGTNPTQAQIQNSHFIKEAQENGATLIHIDPTYNPITSKCDIHVPLRPGTDGALAMAMINIILENGWTDEAFIKKSTVGPFLAKESDGKFLRLSDISEVAAGSEEDAIVVRGADGSVGVPADIADPVITGSFTIKGIKVTTAFDLLVERVAEWTPERASELCDIPVKTIEEITEICATKTPCTTYCGYGVDHYVNGHSGYMAIFAMAMITGNVGKRGASAGIQMPLGFNLNTAALTTVEGAVGNSPPIALNKIPYIMDNKQYGGEPYEIRSVYNYCHNPLANTAGHTEMITAYSKLDLLVVSDWRMTDTARYADIVLPTSHWFESNDIHGMISQTPFTILQEKAVDPPAECKSDLEIVTLLAEGMGFGEHFNLTDMDAIELLCTGPAPTAFGLSYEKIMEEKVIRGPYLSNQPDGTYIHGEGGVFPTKTGRAIFYFEEPKADHYYGPEQTFDPELERMAYWEPPHEAWPETVGGFERNELAEKYPLIYTSERSKLKTHTMFGHNPWLLELIPEPVVKVNPADAQERGIKEGDYARLYNDRGSVVLKMVYSNGVRPGMVVVPKGWEFDQFKEGHYSSLVSNATHGYILNNNYFDNLCQMEKA